MLQLNHFSVFYMDFCFFLIFWLYFYIYLFFSWFFLITKSSESAEPETQKINFQKQQSR